MKSFIIVVDMQRDFVASDGALPVPEAAALVLPMEAWLGALQADTVAGVLFTEDTHIPEIYAQSQEGEQFPPHCVRGSPGCALVVDPSVLAPDIPHYTLEKGVFDMWAEPRLTITPRDGPPIDRDLFFAQLREQGVAVTVVGVAADYCVRWAVEGLIARGIDVSVVGDLTRGISRQIESVNAEEWAEAGVTITPFANGQAGPCAMP